MNLHDMFFMMKSELLLTVSIFIILFIKITSNDDEQNSGSGNTSLLNIINVLLLINVICGFFMNSTGSLFGDMFRNTPLIAFEKNILAFGTLVVSLISYNWLKNHKHVYEFYLLMLSTLLGMFFMISSGNLMMFYVGLELSTIPLAALANFDLDKKRSSEAAMKMIMMSAFASGILLLGISFIYGTTGTLQLDLLPGLLYNNPLQIFAMIILIAGFSFKISAVPFHLWTADVYEGAPAAVTAYLSVISKGAVLFVMTSVLYNAFSPLKAEWYQILFLLSVATMVIGNLFALRQTNLKRLLAFSSIAQVGFILVGMSGQSADGEASIIYFVLIYLFSNLGAFGVITLVSALTGKDTLDDYSGFYKTNPFLTWVLALSLFSLAGIPPAAGFFAKFFLLMAGAAQQNYMLIVIAALNMVVALYYYLVVIKVMFTGKNADPIGALKIDSLPAAGLIICLAGILIAGMYGGVYNYIHALVLQGTN
jgi:NADH-quinone oxidoreductase subunit N